MKCPFCKSDDTQVIDSRVSDDGESIRRRRRCVSCHKRFTTYETVELRMPQVVKQDGTRTEFDLNKLRTGFMRALHKRPVPTDSPKHLESLLREASARAKYSWVWTLLDLPPLSLDDLLRLQRPEVRRQCNKSDETENESAAGTHGVMLAPRTRWGNALKG